MPPRSGFYTTSANDRNNPSFVSVRKRATGRTIPQRHDGSRLLYFVNARITLAEMCRKKMEAMNDSDRTRTMKGSLLKMKYQCDVTKR